MKSVTKVLEGTLTLPGKDGKLIKETVLGYRPKRGDSLREMKFKASETIDGR